jgi:Tfp pilus assembly protein PilV
MSLRAVLGWLAGCIDALPMKTLKGLVDGLPGEQGFTLAEVLMATAMLIVGVAVVLSALMYGVAGVEGSRGQSTAVFLAEQKLEEVRAYAVSTASNQGFANLNSSSFPAESSITGYPNFRRTVTITANAGGNADLQLVAVTVFYKPIKSTGLSAETSITVNSLVSRR